VPRGGYFGVHRRHLSVLGAVVVGHHYMDDIIQVVGYERSLVQDALLWLERSSYIVGEISAGKVRYTALPAIGLPAVH
jgi:hypothetical protein